MVQFILEKGKKGENDTVVLVYSYGEVFSFSELLFLLKHYFESEDSYYPIAKGYRGKCMLLSAIFEVACGRDLDLVLKDYKLDRKGKKLNIVDKRKGSQDQQSRVVDAGKMKVADFM